MSYFQNILVGIDLSHCAQLSPSALPPDTLDLVRRSIWLAQKSGGKLTFFAALNLTQEVFLMLEEKHRIVVLRKIEDKVCGVLSDLVEKAKEQGVAATAVFVRGQAWLEIINQVLRVGNDLVLLGNRRASGGRQVLLGNVARKLLRRCPCPVWVSRPTPYDRPLSVLVADDLQPVSETALHLAIGLGKTTGATIHVLHAVDYPVYHFWLTGLPEEVGWDYHRRVLADAERRLSDQLERTDYRALGEPVRVHLADKVDRPDDAILKCICEYNIDLLVMGTMSHARGPGILIGNTAERLLLDVTCAVLAVKPPDFRGPIRRP